MDLYVNIEHLYIVYRLESMLLNDVIGSTGLLWKAL